MLVAHSSSTCDVCLERYSSSRSACSIPCGHVFCGECLITLATRACPLCRRQFLIERVRKLHIDLATEDDSTPDTEERQLGDRVANISIDGSQGEDCSAVIEDILAWLVNRPADTHRILRESIYLVKRLQAKLNEADFDHQVSKQDLASAKLDLDGEKRKLKDTEDTWSERLKDTKKEYERKLEWAEAERQRLEAELETYTASNRKNPLPAPPEPVDFTWPPGFVYTGTTVDALNTHNNNSHHARLPRPPQSPNWGEYRQPVKRAPGLPVLESDSEAPQALAPSATSQGQNNAGERPAPTPSVQPKRKPERSTRRRTESQAAPVTDTERRMHRSYDSLAAITAAPMPTRQRTTSFADGSTPTRSLALGLTFDEPVSIDTKVPSRTRDPMRRFTEPLHETSPSPRPDARTAGSQSAATFTLVPPNPGQQRQDVGPQLQVPEPRPHQRNSASSFSSLGDFELVTHPSGDMANAERRTQANGTSSGGHSRENSGHGHGQAVENLSQRKRVQLLDRLEQQVLHPQHTGTAETSQSIPGVQRPNPQIPDSRGRRQAMMSQESLASTAEHAPAPPPVVVPHAVRRYTSEPNPQHNAPAPTYPPPFVPPLPTESRAQIRRSHHPTQSQSHTVPVPTGASRSQDPYPSSRYAPATNPSSSTSRYYTNTPASQLQDQYPPGRGYGSSHHGTALDGLSGRGPASSSLAPTRRQGRN